MSRARAGMAAPLNERENTVKTHTMTTSLLWHDGVGNEREVETDVTYTVHPARAASLTEPAEPASVEILDVSNPKVPDHIAEGQELKDECAAHYREMLEQAAEYRAESAREERRSDA